ncbi:MAG TPA: DUF885 domain-containing protein [Parvularcula sp.]|nr:DUF885 domain-containing protein [Parvularcula sp.]
MKSATQKLTLAALAAAALMIGGTMPAHAASRNYRDLLRLFDEWRAFEAPIVRDCVPDYTAAAMAAKAEGLADFRKRLAAFDDSAWTPAQRTDLAYVEAEMNGLDFDLRVMRPWARDPSFYALVFGEESDVPEHEGPNARPAIDLYKYRFPLSQADQKDLTCRLGAVPALLEQAKVNLKQGNARDLFAYGERAFRWQIDALKGVENGTSAMRTLEGPVRGSLEGASPALKDAFAAAREASEAFIQWIKAEAPSKTGPSGVGKDNYDWYMKHVRLTPYGWEEQVSYLRRELERARASLTLEEFRNRSSPSAPSFDDEAAYLEMARAKMAALTDFLIESGIVADKPYYRDALRNQIGAFTPPGERNFFSIGAAFDPTPLYSHFYHWIELAMRKHEAHKSPIRAAEPLYDLYDGRSEGMATAMEEIVMHMGLYDDNPRSREIVWIMLANRAARGLASLYVAANEMSLDEAGEFHAKWTPRKWSDPTSDLVGFEQLLYLRQPGYGASYVTGKIELDRLMSEYAFIQEQKGEAFNLAGFFKALNASGIIPFALIQQELGADAIRAGGAR